MEKIIAPNSNACHATKTIFLCHLAKDHEGPHWDPGSVFGYVCPERQWDKNGWVGQEDSGT